MSRRKRKQRREAFLGGTLIAVALLILAGIGIVYWTTEMNRMVADETFCPLNEPPPSVTAVLVDTTDRLSVIQRLALRQQLLDLRNGLERYGAIEVYTVGPIKDAPLERLLRVCNPGRGQDIDPLIGSPELVENRWDKKFRAPLDSLFDRLVTTDKTADFSPIMEAIQSISLTSFGGSDKDQVKKRLIIASDLLQHSQEFSHYRGDSAETFYDSQGYRRLLSDMRDVEVEVLYVERNHPKQGNGHLDFWATFIAQQGGHISRVRKING